MFTGRGIGMYVMGVMAVLEFEGLVLQKQQLFFHTITLKNDTHKREKSFLITQWMIFGQSEYQMCTEGYWVLGRKTELCTDSTACEKGRM